MAIPSINTLERFQYNLNMGPGYDNYVELLKAVEFTPEELDKICHFKDEKHSRICLYDSPDLEAIATCWLPGQQTAIHNYEFNHGWVKIITGGLTLQYFGLKDGKPVKTNEIELHKDSTFYLNDTLGYHRFINTSGRDTMALFIYSDKVTHWTAYDEQQEKFTVEDTYYDLHLDKKVEP